MTAMSPLPETEETDLLRAAQAGDRQAFARLVGDNYDFLFRAAWRWTGNRADAEDIAQEVAIRMARAIVNFDGRSALRTFLYTMTLNAVRDHGRHARRQRQLAEGFAVHALVETQAMSGNDPAERLWDAVRELPEKQRDAVLLVHGEGLSHAQAAASMGCAEKTVSWHIHAARKRLRDLLAEEPR
jgi:RNA polymerase sigma-70 factor (ECF subfamily)